MKRLPTRKRIRLALDVYEGPGAFSVTISTADRQKHFLKRSAVGLCILALEETAARQGVKVLAYCFMPDHLHVLLEGTAGTNLIRFMKAFKQTSGYRYREIFGAPLWQKGYYDHILRRDEDVRVVAEYIFGNPVRAGLVESVGEYPFLGGMLFDGFRAT